MWFDEGDCEVFGSFESVKGGTATAAYDGQLRLSARRGVRTREGRDGRNSRQHVQAREGRLLDLLRQRIPDAARVTLADQFDPEDEVGHATSRPGLA